MCSCSREILNFCFTMAKCKSSVSSLWNSAELIVETVKLRAKNPCVYIVCKHHISLIPVVFWGVFFLVALYFLTVLLPSFSNLIFSLLWSHSSHSWSQMGLQKEWALDGNCINTCDRVIAWLSLKMSFFDLY